ncbi:MAG: SUMF1/EgtB/PvdO family nonheme iron enzyme, partial [Planctomycetota bacterium]|nr:SUMF1/EgtB/PvdO family nonheme iron enzyme [Planctomycetota bacterium]
EGGNEEKPAHKVKISKPFYMGKYHVTVAQFRAFVDATKHVTEAEKAGHKGYTWDNGWKELGGVNWMKPNFPQEDNHPVCLVTWNDAQEFCKWAAKKTGRNACLPTEAQWEYACRAGTTTKFNTGDKDSDLEQAGWFNNNSGMRTHPAGQKKPNAWGLYDMHGNVWHWVQDYFNDKYYADSPPVDPKGPTSGGDRVLRGGGWNADPGICRAAHRSTNRAFTRCDDFGFRLALDVAAGAAAAPEMQPDGKAAQPDTASAKPESKPAESPADKAARLFQPVLTELAPLLKENKFSDALALLNGKLKAPAFADAPDVVKREIADIEAVTELRKAALEALRKQVGQKVTLKKGSGVISGKVKDEPGSKRVALDIGGGAETVIPAEQIHVDDIDQYAPSSAGFQPAGAGAGKMPALQTEDFRRRGLLYFYAGNVTKAKECFTKARDAGLGDKATPYLDRIATLELGKTEATAAPKPDAQRWISLFDGKTLDGWELQKGKDGEKGKARVEAGNITLTEGNPAAAIQWKGQFPTTNYEIELEAMRIQRIYCFCALAFPLGRQSATLVVGDAGGKVVGLDGVDGKDAWQNITGRRMDFEGMRWYRVRLRVTEPRVEAWVDDTLMVDLPTAGHQFGGQTPSITLFTYKADGAIRNIRFRVLQPRQALAGEQDAGQTAPDELAKEMFLDLGGGVKMEMVLVKAGEFDMGSNDADAKPEEKPVHKVKISKPFYIAKNEVTVAQFRAFADATKYQTEAEKANEAWTPIHGKMRGVKGAHWRRPVFPQEDNCPASAITWNDAQEFCKWAAKMTGRNVCLPSEAQWEYACRAGTTTRYNSGDKDSDLEQAAWVNKNSGAKTNPVGKKAPNAWGLYDMHGNVWEWVQDAFNDKYYQESPPIDPKGPATGEERVLRGGGWDDGPGNCRAAGRFKYRPDLRDTEVGFRVVVECGSSRTP